MTSSLGVVVLGAWNLASKLLESLSLGLGDQKSGEDAAKHEEGEDFHDVGEPWVGVGLGWVALGSERTEYGLCDDGTDLAGSCRETMRGRSVAGWEAFSRNDEGGGVGSEVEEELSQDIKSQETTLMQFVVREADDNEDDSEQDETHKLNGFPTDGVDRSDGDPITGNGTGADNDQVADSISAEDFVDVAALGEADGGQNNGVVETETVKSDVQEEP